MTYRNLDQRNYRVHDEHFALVPKGHVPRATFRRTHEFKFTGQTGHLCPILVDEVLPGDVHTGNVTIFARLAALLFPLMDNANIDTQFFFVPARILWSNWKKFQGEQAQPGDSIAFTVPQLTLVPQPDPTTSGLGILADLMGIPISNLSTNILVNALPFRAYNLIWNEWYRDQNLQGSVNVNLGDGPDNSLDYAIRRRNKIHDYFSASLPSPQKGTAPALPLQGTAPIIGLGVTTHNVSTTATPVFETNASPTYNQWMDANGTAVANHLLVAMSSGIPAVPQIFADLSQATAANVNALRLAVQTQKLLESDMRGGTRYTEILRNRWGLNPQDARLQRPEYVGGGTSPFQTAAIAQTSGTGATGTTTQLGSLAGQSVGTGTHHFTCIGYEHGYLIGLMSIMTKPTYQQGLHRMWTRQTRYDFAMPEFAALGEQVVRNDEIWVTGQGTDSQAFGYQERYAEYRFAVNRTAGKFRSTNTGAIDQWHLGLNFTSQPTLGATFVAEQAPFNRVLAAGSTADNQQFYADLLFNIRSTRPLPAYGVPGGLPGTF